MASRLLQFVAILWIVATFSFFLIRLIPGDPVDVIYPVITKTQETKHRRAEIVHDLGLDKSLVSQYFTYMGHLITGDSSIHGGFLTQRLGKNYGSDRPVWNTLKGNLAVSLELMIYAQVLALVLAIPLGVFSAYRAGSRADRAINATSFGLLAMPTFVLAIFLSLIVGVSLGWLPTGGYAPGWLDPLFNSTKSPDLANHFKDMILPSFALAAGQIAVYLRLLRSDMIATLQENFVTMARSKGISDRRILWRHALRPSSITLLTVAGLNVGTLIGGAVIVEL